MSAPLAEEDRALLERLAARIVALHLEVPAVLALESAGPMGVVAGQTLLFFEPFAQALFRLPDYQRFAALVEQRGTFGELARMIESEADRARGGRPRDGAGGGPAAPEGRP